MMNNLEELINKKRQKLHVQIRRNDIKTLLLNKRTQNIKNIQNQENQKLFRLECQKDQINFFMLKELISMIHSKVLKQYEIKLIQKIRQNLSKKKAIFCLALLAQKLHPKQLYFLSQIWSIIDNSQSLSSQTITQIIFYFTIYFKISQNIPLTNLILQIFITFYRQSKIHPIMTQMFILYTYQLNHPIIYQHYPNIIIDLINQPEITPELIYIIQQFLVNQKSKISEYLAKNINLIDGVMRYTQEYMKTSEQIQGYIKQSRTGIILSVIYYITLEQKSIYYLNENYGQFVWIFYNLMKMNKKQTTTGLIIISNICMTNEKIIEKLFMKDRFIIKQIIRQRYQRLEALVQRSYLFLNILRNGNFQQILYLMVNNVLYLIMDIIKQSKDKQLFQCFSQIIIHLYYSQQYSQHIKIQLIENLIQYSSLIPENQIQIESQLEKIILQIDQKTIKS